MSVTDLIGALDSLPKFENEVTVKSSICPGAPDWLTEVYLENALKKFYHDQRLKIVTLNLRPALGKGENFGGVLTRLKVDFRRGDGSSSTGHYIVKTSFEGDEFARKAMEPYDIFNREMSIYEHVLPKLKSLLLEIGDKEEIFAQTMTVDYDRSALVFEDLNARGFVMPDRLKALDLKLARLVLHKLAKMHATSAVLNERENGSLESYDRGMFNRHTENYAPCFLGLLAAATRRVSQWPGYEKYAQKLESLLPVYMELGKRVFDVTQGHINVLSHGDLWTNNVLVKYDAVTREPLDVIIIDFQYAAWGSPAIDLFYFLNSSLEWDLHQHHQEELIHYYFDQFSSTLRKLRFKGNIPSLHRFRQQIRTKEFYAMHTSFNIFPIHRNVETEDADFNALMQNDQRAINFKDACYANPVTQRVLKELLPYYERKGLLDANQ